MSEQKHWIFRIGDGKNFRNSKFSIWGVKRKYKSTIEKINCGDIIWFLLSKKYGGKIIAMAEFCKFYDNESEPLLKINTITNKEQNWEEGENWDLLVYYCNLYDTNRQNLIPLSVKCRSSVMGSHIFSDIIGIDLKKHYENFKFYSNPKDNIYPNE